VAPTLETRGFSYLGAECFFHRCGKLCGSSRKPHAGALFKVIGTPRTSTDTVYSRCLLRWAFRWGLLITVCPVSTPSKEGRNEDIFL